MQGKSIAGRLQRLPSPRGLVEWFITANVVALFVLAVLFRVYKLGNLPGVNGDEAWFAVQYFDFLRGQATSLATPTGNFNPFYYGLLALGQFLLSPSLSTLRFASAVSGLALILITYQLIRRLASTHVALASALLMAVLPVNIIYSRIGWGPSQTVLAALVVVFFGVQLRTIALSVAFLAAFLVHPTTVFLMPVALAPLLYHEVYVKGRRFTSLALPIGGLGVLTLAGALMTYLAQPETVGAVLQKIPDRLRDPATLWNVAIHYVQLFSGTTSYRYICGSAYSSRTVVWDVVVALLMLGLLVFGGLRVWRKKGVGLALLGGLLISLAGSCAVAGPEILYPHYERYGLFLVAPSVLIFSVLIGELPRLGSHPWRMLGLVSLAGWFFLGTFALDFVGFLFQTGGRSEYTFRTGPKEPKQAAYDIIETDRPPRSQIIVLASSWWNYMPIRYLMAYRGNLDEGDRVINLHAAPENVSPLPQTTAQTTYVVTFADDPVERWIRSGLESHIAHTWAVKDYGGSELLYVHRLTPAGWRSPPAQDEKAPAGDQGATPPPSGAVGSADL